MINSRKNKLLGGGFTVWPDNVGLSKINDWYRAVVRKKIFFIDLHIFLHFSTEQNFYGVFEKNPVSAPASFNFEKRSTLSSS